MPFCARLKLNRRKKGFRPFSFVVNECSLLTPCNGLHTSLELNLVDKSSPFFFFFFFSSIRPIFMCLSITERDKPNVDSSKNNITNRKRLVDP